MTRNRRILVLASLAAIVGLLAADAAFARGGGGNRGGGNRGGGGGRDTRRGGSNKSDDKKKKELVEARNMADSLIYSTEKSLKEYGGKVAEAEKGAIEADLAALKEAVKGDDAAAIKSKTEALSQSSMKLGEAMYKASQEAAAGEDAAAGTPGADGGKGEDVVDADFEEVDDDKNGKKKSA